VVGGGFMVVNTVVVGQILSAVSDYKMSVAVGCVIIAIIGYIVALFGFKVIHTYEKYSWIVAFILLCVLIGQIGPKMDTSIPNAATGLTLSGSMLSFIALNFSSASGWCSIAADYYCNYPADSNRWKIGALTFFGICIPTIFTTIIGACLGNVAVGNEIGSGTAADPALAQAYLDNSLGGLLLESFHPTGFSTLSPDSSGLY
jgi:purine-cytosine permease-like protein